MRGVKVDTRMKRDPGSKSMNRNCLEMKESTSSDEAELGFAGEAIIHDKRRA